MSSLTASISAAGPETGGDRIEYPDDESIYDLGAVRPFDLALKSALASAYLTLGWAAATKTTGWKRWALFSSAVAVAVMGSAFAVRNTRQHP